jgi:hypothetical protein
MILFMIDSTAILSPLVWGSKRLTGLRLHQ